MPGQILLFGKLRDIAGASELPLRTQAAGSQLSCLSALIVEGNTALAQALAHASVRVAINLEIVQRGADPLLLSGSEVAYTPPMSGG